jgi:hypothetical protein
MDPADPEIEVQLSLEWPRVPLRCPHCGNRGAGVGQFWVRTWVQLDADTARPVYIHPPREEGLALECGRCEYEGRLSEFMPPWPDLHPDGGQTPSPLPLSPADRAAAVAWTVSEVIPRAGNDWS